MRVLTSNYQAEYGRNSNGVISVVTKGGGQEFHGSAWANKRHEMFNAKSFFQNYNGQQKSVYRFFVWGYLHRRAGVHPEAVQHGEEPSCSSSGRRSTPSRSRASRAATPICRRLAQRAGDFSGYTDGNGVPFSLTDPTTGNPVPNNNIAGLVALNPAAAKAGQAILNALPLPNICGHPGVAADGLHSGRSVRQPAIPAQLLLELQRDASAAQRYHPLDYNPTSKLNSWVRYINDYDLDTTGSFELKNSQGKFAPFAIDHPNPGHGYAVGITYTISPDDGQRVHLRQELQHVGLLCPRPVPDSTVRPWATRRRSTTLRPIRNFLADQNKERPGLSPGSQNLQIGIPNLSFGGGQLPNEASFTDPCSGQCPYTNWNDIYSFNDTVSKVWGKHNLKAGLYYRTDRQSGTEPSHGAGSYLGAYNFASSTAMPNNTQDGYANAFLGNFNSYTEGGRDRRQLLVHRHRGLRAG